MENLDYTTTTATPSRERYIYPTIGILEKRLFGCLDIETFPEKSTGEFIPYCVAVYFQGEELTAYFGDVGAIKRNRKNKVVINLVIIVISKLFTVMNSKKIKSAIIYAHNLSSFDGYFILRACVEHGFNVKVFKRGPELYFIKIKYLGMNLEFRCSLLLLRTDLNTCAQSFGVEMSKLPFLHEWVNESRLFYSGENPFLPEGEAEGPFEFKAYALKYCLNDCKMLYNIITVFEKRVGEFGINLLAPNYSIPGLAFKAFKTKYLESNSILNLSSYKSVDEFVREGYYGGRTEVFRSYIGDNQGYYYDVKGMYAEAMKQSLPCGDCSWYTQFPNDWLNENMAKGFYRVVVEAPYMSFPVLPTRAEEDGKLIFPYGEWVGIYYSEELLFAKSRGYKFQPIEAVVFSNSAPILKKYVEDFTTIKEMGGAYRAIGKLFINSLYGRFGLKRRDEVTRIIPREQENYYSTRFEVYDRVELGQYLLLVYSPKPQLAYYKENKIFRSYLEDVRKYKQHFRYSETNVAVAAAITALGRIRLYKDMISVTSHGGKIAYCDTDSIFAEFDKSPLGETHGEIYWDPENPMSRFEEGVFLAPKMYSIKNHPTHVKGLKVGAINHQRVLECLTTRAESLSVKGLYEFHREKLNIKLRPLSKEFLLWSNDKRQWIEEDGVWVTHPLGLPNPASPDSPGRISSPLISHRKIILSQGAEAKYFSLNSFNPRPTGYQVLENEIQITTYKTDVYIELRSDSSKFDILYYCILAKLNLPLTPLFMKILYITMEGKIYTMDKFMYNPKIRFNAGLDMFIYNLQKLMLDKMEEYEIKVHGTIKFVIVFPQSSEVDISKFEVVWPLPGEILEEERLKGMKAWEDYKAEIQKKLADHELTQEGYIKPTEYLPSTTRLAIKLKEKVKQFNIIDDLVLSADLQGKIKEAIVKGLMSAHIESKLPSLQQILGFYLRWLNNPIVNKEMFSLCVKAGILLIRSLVESGVITLKKPGQFAPYILRFEDEEDESAIRAEYYNDKISFAPKEFPPLNNTFQQTIGILENTPVYLNQDYFNVIWELIRGVKENSLPREKLGFSLDPKSFTGEMLNLEEAETHYNYITLQMKKLDQNFFYALWFKDYRGRLYPKLTNFSIQSNKIIRFGFYHTPTVGNTITKENLYDCTEYMSYIVDLAKKWLPECNIDNRNHLKENFNRVCLILVETPYLELIKGKKEYYELIVRKIELTNILEGKTVTLSPVSLDGKCNVYQHISALTKDEKIAPLVNTTSTLTTLDFYDWFKTLFVAKLNEEFTTHSAYIQKLDLRKLVKTPVMTFAYGSTLFNIKAHLKGFFKERSIKLDWRDIFAVAKCIDQLRLEHLSNVVKLQNLLQEIIKAHQNISWRLPDGLVVHQRYFKKEEVVISTTIKGREMKTTMLYSTARPHWLHHQNGITANFIHSLDAYHLRVIIKALNKENINILPIHDSVVVDIHNIRGVKIIVSQSFNKIYATPEVLLKSFWVSIYRANNIIEYNEEEMDNRIQGIMGKAQITANKDFFNY